jgi:PAS domain S-box-containing protein
MCDKDATRDNSGSAHSEPQVPQAFVDIVLRNTGEAMCIMRDLRIVAANQLCLNMFGYDNEEFCRLGIADLLTPRSLQQAKQTYDRHIVDGAPADPDVLECVRKNGEVFYATVSAISWPVNPRVGMGIIRDVTMRERGIDDLRNSERLYRTLAETLPAGVTLRDASGNVVYVNDKAVELTGYTRQELIDDAIPARVDEESRSVFSEAWRKGVAIGPREVRFQRKDGSLRWISVACEPILGAGGSYQGMCFAFLDITDRKETEEELQKKQTQLAAISLVFPDIYFHLSKDCRVLGYYAGLGSNLLMAPEDFVGKSVDDFLPADVAGLVREAVERTIRTGEMTSAEYELSLHGTTMYEQARFMPFEDGAVVLIEDVTERNAAEEELRKGREDLNRAQAVAHVGSWYCDLATGANTWSDEASRIIGKPPGSALSGHEFIELVHPDDREYAAGRWKAAVEDNEPYDIEYRIIVHGVEKWVRVRSESETDANGKVLALFGSIQDVTERRCAEEALKKAHRELEVACGAQSEFIRNITHDIRTPMTSVMGYAKILLEGSVGPINSDQETMLNRMLVSAETLLRMMENVLETARLASGATELRSKYATPTRIAADMVSTLYSHAARKGISLTFRGPDEEIRGFYDPDKIRTILMNVISNAIKYTSEGGVEVIASAAREASEIIVVDSGIGIQDDKICSIFEEFTQLDQRATAGQIGFGLGLSIVAKLLDAMQASLIISTACGLGTAITLYFPSLETLPEFTHPKAGNDPTPA